MVDVPASTCRPLVQARAALVVGSTAGAGAVAAQRAGSVFDSRAKSSRHQTLLVAMVVVRATAAAVNVAAVAAVAVDCVQLLMGFS